MEKSGSIRGQLAFLLLWSQRTSLICIAANPFHSRELHGGAAYGERQRKKEKTDMSGHGNDLEYRLSVCIQICGFFQQ